MTTIKRVIFIRPGETDWNRLGRWQGWVAVPLNANGLLQAQRLANFVRHLGLGALYSSDLRRAADTAEALAARLGSQPVYDGRLRERHMGEWQGLTLQEIREWYPQEYQRVLDNPESYQMPGGESRRQVAARARAAFEDIEGRGRGETVGIISHTTAIRSLLHDLVPGCAPFGRTFSNMSVTTIARDGLHWRVVEWNDVSHLEGMETQGVGELGDRES